MDQNSNRCSLCGDKFHDDPDTEGWMGLICPGAQATEEVKEAFRSKLAKAYAEHILQEFNVLNEAIAQRRRLWYERVRTEVAQEVLQADCDERTTAELIRQSKIIPTREFEVDSPHLTVLGQVPQRPPLTRSSSSDKTEPEDAMLYIDQGTEAADG